MERGREGRACDFSHAGDAFPRALTSVLQRNPRIPRCSAKLGRNYRDSRPRGLITRGGVVRNF